MNNKKQAGSSIVMVIVFVLVLAGVGYLGYRLYGHFNKATVANSKVAPTTNTSTTSATSSATYLDIKELGIKIRLSDAVKDAVYSYSDAGSLQYPQYKGIASISTNNLVKQDADCKPDSEALGTITKISGDVDNRGNKLLDNGSNILKLGDDFYILDGTGSPCSSNAQTQALETQQLATFREDFKTIQLDK